MQGEIGDITPPEGDLSFGNRIITESHYGTEEGCLPRPVWSHQYMGFSHWYPEVYSMDNLLSIHFNVKIFNI
jgi:hypothetical protein